MIRKLSLALGVLLVASACGNAEAAVPPPTRRGIGEGLSTITIKLSAPPGATGAGGDRRRPRRPDQPARESSGNSAARATIPVGRMIKAPVTAAEE